MEKQIGFRRNIYGHWLDAAAAFAAETEDAAELRTRLEPIVGAQIASRDNRREAIDIVVNIWGKTRQTVPVLHREAVATYQATAALEDRLWLHYGLTLVAYPFFRDVAAVIGQLLRFQDAIVSTTVKRRVVQERGQPGALEKAVERVVFSLRDWGMLVDADKRTTYRACPNLLPASTVGLESWLLACSLQAHPAHQIPFGDLLRLPELFPFSFCISVDHLRRSPYFSIERQGIGWEMVGLAQG